MTFHSQAHPHSVSQRSLARAFALTGIIGPLWFTVLVVLQGLLQPDYSHVRMPISALAAWPAGWIQNVNFYVTGALTVAFALALHRGVRSTRRGATGVVLQALGGLGVVLAGVFPWRNVASNRPGFLTCD
jgi:hypothetical membrane protein